VSKKLMIIAGEASGDLHGASLIKEIKNLDNGIEIHGIGGDKMIEAGMNAEYHIKDMAFLGFAEVIKHIPFIKKVQKRLLEIVKEKNIDSIILIDYPGFNLSIAKKFKKLKKKLIYYISPQIWAWGKGRIQKIKKIIDKMIVIFPFEDEMYKSAGIDSEYVGHPLIDRINNYQFQSEEELFDNLNLEKDKEILLLMPGSRKQEIIKIFPECIKAADKLSNEFNLQVVVACSENIDEKIFDYYKNSFSFKVIKNMNYDLLKHSHFGIIKSGTSTIEAGVFQLPFIVVYNTSRLTYLIGKSLIKVNNIAMANIVAGETIVPELIQDDVHEQKIISESRKILLNSLLYHSVKNKLRIIKEKLQGGNPSKRAAEIIFNTLYEAERN
jgi:lipid-A-disaccharide synthase